MVSADLTAEGLEEREREALSRRVRDFIQRFGADIAVVHRVDGMMQSKMEHTNRYAQEGELFWDRSRFALAERLPDGVVLKNLVSGEELTILPEGDQLLYKGESLEPFSLEKKEFHPAKQEGIFAKYTF